MSIHIDSVLTRYITYKFIFVCILYIFYESLLNYELAIILCKRINFFFQYPKEPSSIKCILNVYSPLIDHLKKGNERQLI